MEPDDLCGMASEEEIKIKMTYEDEYVFIEGDCKTLEFLGNLFIAQARSEKDCGFQISYNGPGNVFFDKSSNVGLYIHRLPCMNHDEKNRDRHQLNSDGDKIIGDCP